MCLWITVGVLGFIVYYAVCSNMGYVVDYLLLPFKPHCNLETQQWKVAVGWCGL